MRYTWIALVILLWSVCLCGELSAQAKKAAKVTYDEHVKPLLADKCFACHNPDKKSSGLILNNYTRVMEGGSSGAVVKPGDPEGSSLYLVVAHKVEPFMPPKSPKLGDDFAMTIHRWIAGGCLENSGSKSSVVNKPKIDIGLSTITKGKPAGPPPMPLKPLPLEPVVTSIKANAITAIASSPWAPLVAVAGHKQVLLYHSDRLELLGVLPFPEGVPQVLKFSRNGSLLLAGGGRGGHSGRVVVWSVTTGERIFALGEETDAVLAADISPDQTQIALAGPGKMLRIFSTKDGKLLYDIKKHTDWITTMEYSPDGVLLATGDRNGGMFVWEAFTGREYFALRGPTACVREITWRTDSNVVAAGSEDGTIRLFEMDNGGQVRTWNAHANGVQSVRYAADGRLVSCGRDNQVKIWDGNGALQKTVASLPDVALRTTFTHDAARVLAGDWTGQIHVWNTADAKKIGMLAANPPSVAEQLQNAQKELAAKQLARDQANAVAAATQAALQKAQTELTAAQKAVGDSASAAKVAVDALPKAKAMADAARAALAVAQADVQTKTAKTKVLSDAAAKAKLEADKAKTDAKLAAAATQTAQLATQAALETTVAQKLLIEKAGLLQVAEKAFVAAQQAIAPAQAAALAAPKRVEAAQVALKAVSAKSAVDQAAAVAATVAFNEAVALVEKWKAAQAVSVTKTPGK